ncbi:MAG TPA: class I SAM-dependent methyltransferase [Trebonia sp.]
MITNLPRAVPAPPGKPVRPEAPRGQERARRLALRPGTWTHDEAVGMRADFDQAAVEWNDDRGAYRPPVLADALARGGPFRGRRAVEIASGTGLLTPLIRAVWPDVVAVDLSSGMLSRSAQPCRIQADASRLPFADGCADAVVLGDGPLFAAEVARVLVDGGPLIVSNALGDGAPFRVPAQELVEAMMSATSRPWNALQSEAHWGIWTILRPA